MRAHMRRRSAARRTQRAPRARRHFGEVVGHERSPPPRAPRAPHCAPRRPTLTHHIVSRSRAPARRPDGSPAAAARRLRTRLGAAGKTPRQKSRRPRGGRRAPRRGAQRTNRRPGASERARGARGATCGSRAPAYACRPASRPQQATHYWRFRSGASSLAGDPARRAGRSLVTRSVVACLGGRGGEAARGWQAGGWRCAALLWATPARSEAIGTCGGCEAEGVAAHGLSFGTVELMTTACGIATERECHRPEIRTLRCVSTAPERP